MRDTVNLIDNDRFEVGKLHSSTTASSPPQHSIQSSIWQRLHDRRNLGPEKVGEMIVGVGLEPLCLCSHRLIAMIFK